MLVMAIENKGSRVELNTLKKTEKDGRIGYKMSEDNGGIYVNFVWCKVCARNKDSLLTHSN